MLQKLSSEYDSEKILYTRAPKIQKLDISFLVSHSWKISYVVYGYKKNSTTIMEYLFTYSPIVKN